MGVRATLDTFPDHRQRRSLPVRLLAQLGPVLSASPEVLHLLGFKAQQIAHDHQEAWQSKRTQVFARLGLNDASP